jgi:hypothetical protein
MEKKLTAAPSLPSCSVPEPLQEFTANMNEEFGRRTKQFGPLVNIRLMKKMRLERNKLSNKLPFSSL